VRTVYVSTLERGGPVSHLETLVPHVMAAGVDVGLVCQSRAVATAFQALGVPARVVPLTSKFDLAGAVRLLPELGTADVVHTHDRRAGLLARPIARLKGAQVVHTYHGLPEEIAPRLGAALDRRSEKASRLRLAWLEHGYLSIESVLARLGMVIAPSRVMADFLVRHGVPARSVEVVPSGIVVRRTDPEPIHAPARIGTVTRLDRWKGVDTLLSACARVRVAVRLDVFGDGPERAVLETQARALGVDATFHGFVAEARDRVGDLDVFVLPSRAENFPISILEAMACAVPVVATRVGGIPELVRDGDGGVLVEADDAGGMARAIEGLITHPAHRDTIARSGARRARERFDPRHLAGRMIQLYERLCASST
jgi:glycosyltransferase involved in cell wall biosynthesis